ncbi:MAG: hypothetical protein HZB15_17650 [Actinobacteria bacterium]|nr:hypothetical protein [Actinomycetota bacterium]
MTDPQDAAESFDEETTGSDPDDEGRMDTTIERPYLAGETNVVEPIVDSVATREARTEPDDDADLAAALDEAEVDLMEADLSEALIANDVELVGDERDLSAEEAAIHVIDPDR